MPLIQKEYIEGLSETGIIAHILIRKQILNKFKRDLAKIEKRSAVFKLEIVPSMIDENIRNLGAEIERLKLYGKGEFWKKSNAEKLEAKLAGSISVKKGE